MGCALTKTEDEHNSVQAPIQAEEFSVFVPGLRLPRRIQVETLEYQKCDSSVKEWVERLITSQSKLMSAAEELAFPKKLKKRKSSLTGSSVMQLKEAIEEYLPVLVRLLRKEPELVEKILFTWTNQEDEIKETSLQGPYYEMLSVLQLLAMLSLLEANKALGFKPLPEGSYHKSILDDNQRTAMDFLFRAAEILECVLKSVLPQTPPEIRSRLPADLTEGVLQALQLQALGQTVEIQLGLAIDNAKATMAVKRRLACEQLKYWQQAYESLQSVPLGNGWGEKHLLFIRWKRSEAKAAAFYFHGLILNETADQQGAIAYLRASEYFLKESEKNCKEFSITAPLTKMVIGRAPPWGPMKHLNEKIPRDISNGHFDEKVMEKLQLPDFPLSLRVDEYQMPEAAEEVEDRGTIDHTDIIVSELLPDIP